MEKQKCAELVLGFTGTRYGLTDAQGLRLYDSLLALKRKENIFRHGDCIGADAQAHDLASELGFHIIIHPGNKGNRAYKKGHEILEPRVYLLRNMDIVDSCDILVACPAQKED